MESWTVNPWEEAKEETKDEPVEVENTVVESVVDEPTAAPPEPPVVTSPMTPLGEARRASDLRNTEAMLNDLENRYAQLRGEKDQVQTDFESLQQQLKDTLEENRTMRESMQGKEKEVEQVKREALLYKERSTTLEEDCKAKDERLSRLTQEADNLREEVSRLSETSKMAQSAVADMESQAKVLSAESLPLFYEVQRLKTEIDTMAAHTKWLDAELVNRNDRIATSSREHNAQMNDLRNQLHDATLMKDLYEAEVGLLKKNVANLESRANKLASENLQLQQEASDIKSDAEKNSIAEKRIIQLQKEQLQLLQMRHDDAVRQMESMQTLARQAAEESKRELEILRTQLKEEADHILETQGMNHHAQIQESQAKLEEANRSRNELEDSMIDSPARASRRTLAAISDGEHQMRDGDEEQLPLNLTDAYTLLRQTQQELREEKKNHKMAQLRLRRIEEDVKAKMPHYMRQRQEYETAVARDQESRKRMKQALMDVKTYRREAEEARHDVVRLQKENRGLKNETARLAVHVQSLLAQQAGGTAEEGIPVSIAEIQKQNQDLLRDHDRLTDELQALKSDPIRSKLEAAEKEIEALKEERNRSETYIASIVQQRDLIRAQLHLDSKVFESETSQGSTLAFSAQHSERIKDLEEKNKLLEETLNKSQAEVIRLKAANDGAADRLLRYEAQVTTLSEALDSRQAQIVSATAEAGRMEAAANYHSEKCSRLEESLKQSAAEVASVSNAKSNLQNINNRLQEALTQANAESSRLQQELSHTQMKLRLAESQAANAKSAEDRAVQEAERLRKDMNSHGSLFETVHRIDATLNAKKDEETNRLKEENTQLQDRLAAEQAKYALDVDRMNGRVHELEIELKELSKRKDDAMTELIRANEKFEALKLEVENLNSKCSRLESQLRSAKSRLGESDGDDEDVEASLQAKIDALTTELESTSAELTAEKESVATYQKIAKDSESALDELTKATNAFKVSQAAEMEELQRQLAATKQEVASRNEAIAELTNDITGLRESHDKVVGELKKQVLQLEDEAVQLRKDAEGASQLAEHMKVDIEKLREEAKSAQDKYDRELFLHSAARTALREARDELEATINVKKTIESQVEGLQTELVEYKNVWKDEKAALEASEKQLQKQIAELRGQNDSLHKELERLGNLVEKSQEERITAAAPTDQGEQASEEKRDDEVGSLQKSVSELRVLIRFLRSEKEMLQVQLDTARREADRERAAAAVVRRSLDDARNELRVLQSNEVDATTRTASVQPSDQSERLRTVEEQVQLLHDSNKLLREETERLQKSLEASQFELAEAKKSLEPLEQKQRKLEIERAGLEAERTSLLRENEAWKGRLQSLVSKFNQIDPVEHENVLKQVDSLKKDLETLRSQKRATDEESQRIKAMAAKVNKDLSQQKALLESQKKTIARLTAEKDSLASSSKSASSAKEREQVKEFKEKLKKFEEENASVKTELAGANERNDNLRDKLRQFQKVIATHKQTEKSLMERYAVLEGELSQIREERLQNRPATSSASDAPTSVEAQKSQEGSLKATEDESATSQSMQVEVVADSETTKLMDTELPLVPPGGFNFGPDRPSTAVNAPPTKAQDVVQVSDSHGTSTALDVRDETSAIVNLEPASTIRQSQPLAPRGDGVQSNDSDLDKRVVIDITSEEQPEEQPPAVDEVQDEKFEGATKAGKEQRRPSGEKKEQSLKEKLLMQKKRRLEAELAQKKAMLSAKTIQAEEMAGKKRAMSDSIADNDASGEHSSKRIKPGEGVAEVEASLSAVAGTSGTEGPKSGDADASGDADEELRDPLENIAEEVDIPKNAEQVEAEDRADEGDFVAGKEPDKQGKIAIDGDIAETQAEAESSDATIANPFAAAPTTSGDLPSKITFGKAAAELKFGSNPETSDYPTLGTFPGASTPPPFGKSASILLPGPGVTGFGTSNESSGVAYGSGAFLDTLKPPGSLPMAKFSFGKAGPITLPTPSITTTTASPFDAFPSADSTQPSGTRTEQLFGQPVGAHESETPEEADRTGVSADTENQDASMGDVEDDGTFIV